MTDNYSVIDTTDGYDEAVAALASGHGPVAVDVERASGFRYSQRASCVQIFRRGSGVFLFDAPAFDDHAPLHEAIGEAEWVFHAASQDLPSLREIGLVPRSLFDTELSARLLGWPKVGLAAVTERTLGIELKKEHSAADWSTGRCPIRGWNMRRSTCCTCSTCETSWPRRSTMPTNLDLPGDRQEFEHVRSMRPKPPRRDPSAAPS